MKNMMKQLGFLLSLILILGILATAVFATEGETLSEGKPVMRIPVEVAVEGELPEEPELFKVSLVSEQEDAPMPEGSVDGSFVTLIKGGEKGYLEIPCEKLGVYNYSVSILPGENNNCIYSTDVYHVTLFILNADEGGYDITAVAYKNDSKDKSEICFLNRYVEPAFALIEAVKLFDGQTPADGAFRFTLSNDKGEVIAEVSNVGKTVIFPEIRCYEEGTFRYTLREVKGTAPKIIYDTTAYDVIVEVSRDGERNYVATVRYEKNGMVLEELPVFRNVSFNPEVPNTGDERNMRFFLILMISAAVAVVAVIFVLVFSRKKREEDQL